MVGLIIISGITLVYCHSLSGSTDQNFNKCLLYFGQVDSSVDFFNMLGFQAPFKSVLVIRCCMRLYDSVDSVDGVDSVDDSVGKQNSSADASW